MYRSSRAWNFVILVKDSGTRGPSLVVVRMEYLFVYHFWYWELWVESLWGGERKHYFVNFFCGHAFNVSEWRLVQLVLYTSLQLQIPCTYSLPALHIYSTSNQRHVWNPVEHLWWSFFAEIVNMLRLLANFAKELHHVSLTDVWQDSKRDPAQ